MAPKQAVLSCLLTPPKTGTFNLSVLPRSGESDRAANLYSSLFTVSCPGCFSCTGDVFISSRSIFPTETPDHVSITPVGHLSAVVENKLFQLQCDITGVAPAQHLTVRWYQGNKTLQTLGKGGRCDLSYLLGPQHIQTLHKQAMLSLFFFNEN